MDHRSPARVVMIANRRSPGGPRFDPLAQLVSSIRLISVLLHFAAPCNATAGERAKTGRNGRLSTPWPLLSPLPPSPPSPPPCQCLFALSSPQTSRFYFNLSYICIINSARILMAVATLRRCSASFAASALTGDGHLDVTWPLAGKTMAITFLHHRNS
jgi:hypothetical protein